MKPEAPFRPAAVRHVVIEVQGTLDVLRERLLDPELHLTSRRVEALPLELPAQLAA